LQIVLRQAEDHGNRLQLRDDHQSIWITGMNNVAHVHLAQANAPADWRSNARIDEIQLYGVNLCLVGADSAIQLAGQ
jgi:hypothetical protein